MATPAPPMPFGVQLRFWREERRISQVNLALLVGMTQAKISLIETGKVVNPGILTILPLLRELEVTMPELLALLPDNPQGATDEPR